MVADLLRVQALFFLANPFIALGHALLVRRLEFKRQSRIDLAAAALSAVTALACAYAGLGVWTLVAAPGALWFSRAAGYFVAAKLWEIRPRFRFEGAGVMLRYGAAMVGGPGLLVRAEPGRRLHRRPRCSTRTGSASTRPPCS